MFYTIKIEKMNWNDSTTETQHLQSRIAYTGSRFSDLISVKLSDNFQITSFKTLDNLQVFLDGQTLFSTPEIIMMEIDRENDHVVFEASTEN